MVDVGLDNDEKCSKRVKQDVLHMISPHILSSIDSLAASYASAKPYPHCVLREALEPSFLHKVILEIKDHSKVDFKESDLFKFYQSMDLANLNGDVVPHVLKLRELLYSSEWRRVIEQILNLPPNTLSSQVDCACNCHANSCHLLCHDDVIRTRKVSYILYLLDEDWTSKDGGALELYASSTKDDDDSVKVPETVPCTRIVPQFNSMGIFIVEPGVSFHAVQEVVRTTGPRLSLQGWYHADMTPLNMQLATLNQLKTMRPTEEEFEDYEESQEGVVGGEAENSNEGGGGVVQKSTTTTTGESFETTSLSREDYDYLALYLDPSYLKPEALQEMGERFELESSLQLRSLFLPEWINPSLSELLSIADKELAVDIDHDEFYQRGVSPDWKLVGPPHMQRYLEYQGGGDGEQKDNKSPGALLSKLRTVLQSPAFARFLSCITTLQPTGYLSQIRRFRPGRDYTVAHYGLLRNSCILDATLVFCAGTGEPVDESTPDENPDVTWQSGDCGGFECYIEVDNQGEDEEYKGQQQDDDNTELLSVSAANNTLSLVYRDPGTMRFVKYLSCQAPSSRWDICMEYRVKDDEESNKDEGSASEQEEQEA